MYRNIMNHDYDQLHLGYYIYDNQKFLTREGALDMMLAKEDYEGNIQFYYNDHIFDKMNWRINSSISISTFYKMRAQQLRDKYKYLILRYSGGSDSTQVLESFLKNKIFLDEIVVINHQKAINNLDRTMMLNDPTLSEYLEYEMAVVPQLKRVKELSPNTKITILDSSDNLIDQLGNKKYEHLGKNDEPRSLRYVVGGLMKNWTPVLIKYEQQTATKEGVAVIRGLEKPYIKITDRGKILFSFYDITMTATLSMQKSGSPYTIEDFFWSPDYPLIPAKQAHMIVDALSKNEALFNEWKSIKAMIHQAWLDPELKSSPGYILDRWYNKIIYPDWNPTTYVAPKPTKISADSKLVSTLGIQHNTLDFTIEYSEYKKKRYEKIVNKQLLNRYIFSRTYYLGEFQPQF